MPKSSICIAKAKLHGNATTSTTTKTVCDSPLGVTRTRSVSVSWVTRIGRDSLLVLIRSELGAPLWVSKIGPGSRFWVSKISRGSSLVVIRSQVWLFSQGIQDWMWHFCWIVALLECVRVCVCVSPWKIRELEYLHCNQFGFEPTIV